MVWDAVTLVGEKNKRRRKIVGGMVKRRVVAVEKVNEDDSVIYKPRLT